MDGRTRRAPGEGAALSRKSLAVLQLIATGHSYEQILQRHPDLTYLDIFPAENTRDGGIPA